MTRIPVRGAALGACLAIVTAVTIGGGGGLPTAMAAPLALVEDGQPRVRILLAEDAGPQATRGAEDLQEYMARMSGAELPIVRDAGEIQRVAQGPFRQLRESYLPAVAFPKPEHFARRREGTQYSHKQSAPAIS